MNVWELFKKSYIELFSSVNESQTISVGSATLIKSGIDSNLFNFFFVENVINSLQKDAFIGFFNCGGLIFSFPNSRNYISTWSEDRITYAGSAYLMTKSDFADEEIYESKHPIKVVENESQEKDLINLMSKIKKVDAELLQQKMSGIVNNNNIVSFVCYSDGLPVGYLMSCVVENQAFIFEAATLDHFRKSGVLSSLGDFGLQYGKEVGINSYSSLLTSEYSKRVVERHGYKEDFAIDIWVSV